MFGEYHCENVKIWHKFVSKTIFFPPKKNEKKKWNNIPLHFEICRSELKHGKQESQNIKHKCKHESRNVTHECYGSKSMKNDSHFHSG
jgi:hypothetical protein